MSRDRYFPPESNSQHVLARLSKILLILWVLSFFGPTTAWADATTTSPAANSPGAAATSPLQASYDAIEKGTVTGRVAAPESLRIGRAIIRPKAGSHLYQFEVDGEKAGYLLTGEARMTYQVEDRFSQPAARHNLKRADGFDLEEHGETLNVSTDLTGLAVWGWDIELAEEMKSEVEPVEERPLPQWLQDSLGRKYSPNPGRDFISSKWHGQVGYRWALLHRKGEDLVLDVDPRMNSRAESLSRMMKPRRRAAGHFAGRHFGRELISQPIGKPWWEGDAIDFVSTKTEIEMLNRKPNHAQVSTKTQVVVQRPGLKLLPMQLIYGWQNNGKWKDNNLLSVKVDGEPASYIRAQHDLLIQLPRPAKKGDTFLLETETEGEIIVRPEGDNYWRLGGEPWYLKPGLGGEEWAEFTISAEVQAPYVAFAPGETLKTESTDSAYLVRTHLKGPMRTAMVIAGKYKTVSQEQDDQEIHISSYGKIKKRSTDKISQVMFSVMDCMGRWLGVPYPFPNLQVVEMRQWGWAQAPPGIIFVTQEAFLTRAAAQVGEDRNIAAATTRGINERVAHEVAHSWFPHVAKVVRGEENWLSESLADYTSAFCLVQQMADKKKADQLFERQKIQWEQRSKEAGDASSVFLANHLSGIEDDGRIRQGLLYNRGPWVLHVIREKLVQKHGQEEGDRMFLTWMRSYVRNFTFKIAETRHFIEILNQISGEDWTPFFERYIYGAEHPEAP